MDRNLDLPQRFDPRVRAKEKSASREDDARALAMNLKSAENLRAENGKFAFPRASIDWSSARRHW